MRMMAENVDCRVECDYGNGDGVDTKGDDFTCHERHGVEYLLTKMTSPTTQALIGGIDPGLCRVASHLADKYGKLFLPWSCLEVPPRVQLKATAAHDSREGVGGGRKAGEEPWAEGSHVAMVTPTALQMARAAVGVLSHFKWRHVVIITVDSSYWRGLAHAVDVELRGGHRLVPALAVLPPTPAEANITQVFNIRSRPLIKAYVLVLPSTSAMLLRVMQVAEEQGITRSSVFLVLDPLYAPTPSPTPARHHARRPAGQEGGRGESRGC
ncbi:retinal guanylyl cyclase 1-like [Penaeus monodon]|uniref:retinal guanylyl cyclase 1-like n=1 Tax=Penaeus monodon TaxID=6687 RepID=UPI0018A74C6C|nr:retinal guanylyl cyclase 1-like [Penaeus monodon]